MRSFWISLSLILILTIGGALAQPFLGPGVVNNTAFGDSQADNDPCVVADSRGNFHAVWISDEPLAGSGSDPDVFYAHGTSTGWASPELVNLNGIADGALGNDLEPALAIGFDNTLHCVWVTGSSYAGSGSDSDILYSQRTTAGWSTPELIDATYATTDAGNGRRPAVTVGLMGTVHVAWETNSSLTVPGTQADWDILHSARTGGTWSSVSALNANAATDTGDDIGGVAMTTSADGVIIAAWSTNENLAGSVPLGTDFDIVWRELPVGGSWSVQNEICQEMTTDAVPNAGDANPAVVSIGSGLAEVIHFVWESDSGAWANGTDGDIIHTSWESVIIPPITARPVNSYATVDGIGDGDFSPTLIIEPGGVLHCLWNSNYSAAGLLGTDLDVLHATSGTEGRTWSAALPILPSAFTDTVADDDTSVVAARAPNGVLGIVWQSLDPLLGTVGADADILAVVGVGRQFSAPTPVNTGASFDHLSPGLQWDSNGDIVVTPTGAMHAVWETTATGLSGAAADYDIFHASRSPNGTMWTGGDLVNSWGNTDVFGDDDNGPRMLIDSQGGLHIFWVSGYNLNGTAGTDGDIFYAHSAVPNWSAPEMVNTTGNSDGTALDVDYSVAISASDEIHIVWTSEANINGSGTDWDIMYSVNSGSGWSAAELVNTAFGTTDTALETDRSPDIAVDSNGMPHIVWASRSNYGSAGADTDIFYTMRSGGNWTAPEFVNTAAALDGDADTLPTIALTSDDVPHVVWSSDSSASGAGGDDDLWTSSRISGNWSPARLFNPTLARTDHTTFGMDVRANAVVDDLDILHVAWESAADSLLFLAGQDYDILYTYSLTPGVATAEEPIVANPNGWDDIPGDDERLPQMAVSADGIVHIAWNSGATLGGEMGTDTDFFSTSLDRVITTSPMIADHLAQRFPLFGWVLWRADANKDGVVNAADVVTQVNARH